MTHCSSFGADSYLGKASSSVRSVQRVNYLKLTLGEKGAQVKIAFEINASEAFCFYKILKLFSHINKKMRAPLYAGCPSIALNLISCISDD